MVFDRASFGLGVALHELRAVPAGHRREAVALQQRREHGRVARKLAAELDAGVASRAAGDEAACREVAAQLLR